MDRFRQEIFRGHCQLSTLQVAVAGAAGRMGRTLVQACAEAADVRLSGALEAPGHDSVGVDAGLIAGVGTQSVIIADRLTRISSFDVLIDFTTPRVALEHLVECADLRRPAVIGTTGFNDAQCAAVRDLSDRIPVVLSPNMSVGINLCLRLLKIAAEALGDGVDVEIIEAHHRHKADAPSGTAVRMGEVVAEALGRNLRQCAVYGREGRTGERDRATIGFETVRAGDIVGEHTVLFAGTGERIEITHRSSSRMNFALGALRAARWVEGRGPGLYDMQQVLGPR